MNKYLILIALLITSNFNSQSQTKKKYPSLLWEITGNGLEKPSYIYGTMHVSNKIAFHLGDTFFIALQNVDQVALESDPSKWIGEMFDSAYQVQVGSYYRNSSSTYDLYNAFKFHKFDKKVVAGALSTSNRMMNSMLYRNSRSNTEFEEETYLDMYIYQAGKKYNKDVIGLEDFLESNLLVMRSRIPDENDDAEKAANRTLRKMSQRGKRPYELMQDAYRNQDLDMVDSIQKLMSASDNHQKYMLVDRNIIMANNIELTLKNGKSLFSGVGAAHLAGKQGMIELLRDKGYKLRPIERKINDKSRGFRNKLEKTYVKKELSLYHSADDLFQVKLPHPLFEFPTAGQYKMYFYPEMANGTTYSLIRLKNNTIMERQSLNYIHQRIDSLLYENIPGKIIERKNITRNNCPGFDILTKTKKSDYERYLILISPLEIFIFKVSGTLDYLKDNNNLDEIFSSFKLNMDAGIKTKFRPLTSNYQFDIPGKPSHDENIPKMGHLGSPNAKIESFDSDSNFYSFNRISYHGISFLEEDSFELSFMARTYDKEFSFKRITSTHEEIDGMPAYYALSKDSTRFVHQLYLLKKGTYFQLLAQTESKQRPADFFNSFKIVPTNNWRNYSTFTDSSNYYSVNTTTKYYGYSSFDRKKYMPKSKTTENDLYDTKTLRRTYTNVPTDEEIVLYIKRFSRYLYYPSLDSFWRDETTRYKNDLMEIYSKSISKDSLQLDLILTDTNTNRRIGVTKILKGSMLYTIKYLSDDKGLSKTGIKSKFYNSFITSFNLMDTMIGSPITMPKGQLWLTDLQGEDSLAQLYAIGNTGSLSFVEQDISSVVKIIETFKHKDFELDDRVNLITKIGEIKSPSSTVFLDKVYRQSIDTAQLQMAVLNALAERSNKAAARLIKEYLEFETPLVSSQDINLFTYTLNDSLALYKNLFPYIYKYTAYPEYKYPVYNLLADMLDSNIIKSKKFKKYKNDILRDGKNALKRSMANEHSNSNGYRNHYSNWRQNFNTFSYSSKSSTAEPIIAISRLLIPFYKDKQVKDYFNRALRLNDDNELLDICVLLAKNDKAVPDTMWDHLASKDHLRKRVLEGLKDLDKLELLDQKWKTQKMIARALIYSGRKTEAKDSIRFFKRYEIKEGKHLGYLYVFKHIDNYDDDEWEYDYISILPLDSTSLTLKHVAINKNTNFIDEDLLDEKMELAIEKLIYKDRRRVKIKSKHSNGYGRLRF